MLAGTPLLEYIVGLPQVGLPLVLEQFEPQLAVALLEGRLEKLVEAQLEPRAAQPAEAFQYWP